MPLHILIGLYLGIPWRCHACAKRTPRISPEPQEPSAPKALETGQRRETWGSAKLVPDPHFPLPIPSQPPTFSRSHFSHSLMANIFRPHTGISFGFKFPRISLLRPSWRMDACRYSARPDHYSVDDFDSAYHFRYPLTVYIVDNSLHFVKDFSRFVLKELASHVYNSQYLALRTTKSSTARILADIENSS